MKFIIRHQLRDMKIGGLNYYVSSLFKKIINNIKNKYPEHTFDVIHDSSYEQYGYGSIYSCMNLSIINPQTQNYILISLFDNWRYHFMKHMGWRAKKMKQFFYAGGFNYMDYFYFKDVSKNNNDLEFPDNIESVYNQFFYNPYFDCCYNEIDNLYNHNNSKEDKLFFKGWMWDFRKEMVNNLNRVDILIFDKNQNNQSTFYLDYLTELSNYCAALSLPGGTEICNRDIECFAIGVPVIRPALNTNYPDPLLPNYHYISCYHACDYSHDGNPSYSSYNDFKNHLIKTWDRVKNNEEYLNFISKNARDWYVKNCSIDNNINLLLNNINLNLLNE